MKYCRLFPLILFCCLAVICVSQEPSDTLVMMEQYDLEVEKRGDKSFLVFSSPWLNGPAKIFINNAKTAQPLAFVAGEASLDFPMTGSSELLLLKNELADGQKSRYRLFHISSQGETFRVRGIPLWLSILPPLIAILLALVFREVIVSLFIGIWVGAFIINGMQWQNLLSSMLEVVQKYVVEALLSTGHLSVIVFSLMIGGMVALISRNGGMAGVVQSLSRYARGPRSTQFITWLLGVAIFFDDYANALIVGNTMRSVTDKFRISREKLAYIVDSTAAPVSAIAFITTWIGAELGYIEGGISQLTDFDTSISAYSIFISSLKYSFYPILTLIFILLLIYFKRDYGSMHRAQVRAYTTGQVAPPSSGNSTEEADVEDLKPVKGAPLRWYNAAIPVLMVILVTIIGLVNTGMEGAHQRLKAQNLPVASTDWSDTWAALPFLGMSTTEAQIFVAQNPALLSEEAKSIMLKSTSTGQNTFDQFPASQQRQMLRRTRRTLEKRMAQIGFSQKLGILIGKADSYVALLWASLLGVIAAVLLTLSGRIMNLFDTMNTVITGFKTMLPALIILTLAWALADITGALYTANYLTAIMVGNVSPYLMPVLIFILSASIAFSTGSSWSTMAILYPIAIPTTWAICLTQGLSPELSFEILLNVISVVLAASVLGDHCSPISDTTILSSLASDCNHIDHVRTQMPYALTVGAISILAGGLSTMLGGGLGICLLLMAISTVTMAFIIRKLGRELPPQSNKT